MSDRMYQVTAMGVLDAMVVEIKVFSAESGRWTHVMQQQVLVDHHVSDDGVSQDLVAIAKVLRRVAQA